MTKVPEKVREFQKLPAVAVVGASRRRRQPGNAILLKIREWGQKVYAVNPNADEIEGMPCYPDLTSLPEKVPGIVVTTHPDRIPRILAQCRESGTRLVWLHRSFGQGSVSQEAIRECSRSGIDLIEGGCPMMYYDPVDLPHRCMRFLLDWGGRLPR